MNKFSKKLTKVGFGFLLISLAVLAVMGIIRGLFFGLLMIFKYPLYSGGVVLLLMLVAYIFSKLDKKPLKF
jgi:predicted Co/Zn/Cd cation transporter (cation efflux family)